MIPIPQYPLYSATLSELNSYQVSTRVVSKLESLNCMSGKPMAQSYSHSMESKTSTCIQPITECKIIAQPIRIFGHCTVTVRHEPYHNYFPLIQNENNSNGRFTWCNFCIQPSHTIYYTYFSCTLE